MNKGEGSNTRLTLVDQSDLDKIYDLLKYICHKLDEKPAQQADYIKAKEFMASVGIKRTKFDQLMASELLKVRRKGRRIYVLATEVKRYFDDPIFS